LHDTQDNVDHCPNLRSCAKGYRVEFPPLIGMRLALTRLYHDHERLAIGAGTLLTLLAAWEIVGRSGLVDPLFVSSPTQVMLAGYALLRDPEFWNDLRVSGLEFVWGYGAAVLIGVVIGLGIGVSKRLDYLLAPFIDTLNAVPRVTLLPLIIIWFGIGIWSKVAVVFLGAVIPIIINTQSGVKTSEARFMRVARSFSASRWKIFSTIVLPGTVPFIFTGLKYGAGRALLGVVVGELYASTAGIGHVIADAGNTLQTDVVFFGVLIFMAAGLIVVTLLDRIERRFERWRPPVGA
jgi:NitT/TauT family transport system permease protein